MTAPTRTRAQSSRTHTRSVATDGAAQRSPQRATQRSATFRRSSSRTVQHPPVPHKSGMRSSGRGGRSSAAQKAYARRAQRSETVLRATEGVASPHHGLATRLKLRLPSSRTGFVLVLMGLLGVGVVLTLWLSTQAIADSYRLEEVRAETASLAEQAERLQRDVTRQQSASALAERARALGMVPSGEPARILVKLDGGTKLFGEPMKAQPRPQPVPAPARKPARQEAEQPPRTNGGGNGGPERPDSRQPATQAETERQQVQAVGTRQGDDEAAGGQ